MSEQAGTWSGLTSSIKDSFAILTATAAKPIFDFAKIGLKSFLDLLSSPQVANMATQIAAGLDSIIARAITWGRQMIAIGQAAYGYGSAIGSYLAQGVMAAAAYVTQALSYLGSIFTYWLQPHSPPKLLPHLDEWGAEAATLYVEGWKNADYSALDDMRSTIKSYLDNMVKTGDIQQNEVIPRLLLGQDGATKLIDDMLNIGTATDDAMNEIRASVGPAADDILAMAETYRDMSLATDAVTEAQQQLNDVTREYDERLTPMNAQLKALKEQSDDIKDRQRIAELNKTIASDKSSADDKELARLEIQQIQLEDQTQAVQDERDTAVDAAQQKLTAAQAVQKQAEDAYNAQKQVVQLRSDENGLIADQIKLLKDEADAAAKAAEAKTKHGGGGAGAPTMPSMPGGGAVPDIKGGIDAQMSGIQKALTDPINLATSDIKTKLDGMVTNIKAALTDALAPWQPAIDSFKERFGATKDAVIEGLGIIKRVASDPELWAALGYGAENSKNAVQNSIIGINDIFTGVFSSITDFMRGNNGTIVTDLDDTGRTLGQIVGTFTGIISEIVQTETKKWSTWFDENGGKIQLIARGTWDTVMGIINGVLHLIEGILITTLDLIKGNWSAAWTDIVITAQQLGGDIKKACEGFLNAIAGIFDTTFAQIDENWGRAWNILSTTAGVILDKLRASISSGLKDVLGFFIDVGSGIVSELGKLPAKAQSLGNDITNGLINGAKANAQRLLDWAANLAEATIQKFKDTFNMKSPSRRTYAIGIDLIVGMINGLAAGKNQLLSSVKELSDDVLKGFDDLKKSAISIVQDMFDSVAKQSRGDYNNFNALNDILGDPKKIDEMKAKEQDLANQRNKAYQTQLDLQRQLNDEKQNQTDLESKLTAERNNAAQIEYELAWSTDPERTKQLQEQLKSSQNLQSDLQKQIDSSTASQSKLRDDLDANAQKQADLGDQQAKQAAVRLAYEQELKDLQSLRTDTERQLDAIEAEADARNLTGTQRSSYVQFRSDQVLEMAKLRKALAEATDPNDQAKISEQIARLTWAQDAELKAYQFKQSNEDSPTQQFSAALSAFLDKLAEDKTSTNGNYAMLYESLNGLLIWLQKNGGGNTVTIEGNTIDMNSILAGLGIAKAGIASGT